MNEEELFQKKREFVVNLMDQGFSETRALAEWNTQQENKDTNPARKLIEDMFVNCSGVMPSANVIQASGVIYNQEMHNLASNFVYSVYSHRNKNE